MKKIFIPHLHYTIEYGIAKGEDAEKMRKRGWNAQARGDGKKHAQILFLESPRKIDFPIVAHEVMHVLQYIAQERSIKMEEEAEHFGYLMQYILNEMLGYEYI